MSDVFDVRHLIVESETEADLVISLHGANEQTQTVRLPRSILPSLAGLLVDRIGPGSVTPIRSNSLFAGQRFRVEGVEPAWLKDGSIDLKIYVLLPEEGNRRVTIPLHFGPDEVGPFLAALKIRP